MTLLHADCMWDGLYAEKWEVIGSNEPSLESSIGRHSSGPNGSLSVIGTGRFQFTLPSSSSSPVFLGSAIRSMTTSFHSRGRANIQMRDSSNNIIVCVNYQAETGSIELRQGDYTGVLLGHTAINKDTNWRHLALEVDPAGGAARLFLETELVIESTGLTLNDIAAVAISGRALATNRGHIFQDVWVATVNLGDARVVPMRPDGPGAADDWEPSDPANANWEQVAGIPVDFDEFVSTDADGARDSLAMESAFVDEDRPDVVAVVALARASKSDGADRDLSVGVRVDGNYYDGPDTAVVGTAVVGTIFEENPATQQPWELAEVEDAEMTYRATKP